MWSSSSDPATESRPLLGSRGGNDAPNSSNLGVVESSPLLDSTGPQPALLPAPDAAVPPGHAIAGIASGTASLPPPRSLSFLDGLALGVSMQIGSGIFSSPSVVNDKVSGRWQALAVWLVGGLMAWTGAASVIELGSNFPLNGGMTDFVRNCYGDSPGFLYALGALFVQRPAGQAMIALIFAEYFYRAVSFAAVPSPWIVKATAVLAEGLLTLLNCLGTRAGTSAASFALFVKIAGMASIAVLGIVWAATGHGPAGYFRSLLPRDVDGAGWIASRSADDGPLPGDGEPKSSLTNISDAVAAALFSYAGWDSVSFVMGELKNPRRNIPLVLNSAMIIVIASYVVVNIAYFFVLPPALLSGSNTVAMDFGMVVCGSLGSLFYAWVACLSCLGTLNAEVFTSGRFVEALGELGYLPSILRLSRFRKDHEQRKLQAGERTERRDDEDDSESSCSSNIQAGSVTDGREQDEVPLRAMILNYFLVVIYIVSTDFRRLVTFKSMTEYTILVAAVSGVFVLRWRARQASKEAGKRSDSDEHVTGSSDARTEQQQQEEEQIQERPYRTYITNPIIFCLLGVLFIARSALSHPSQFALMVSIFGCGVLLHQFKRWREPTAGGFMG